jgi:hypothetical protein
MTGTLSLRWHPRHLSEFDPVAARFEATVLSFSESEALKAIFWDAGEDARLREDERFCPTAWGRWILRGREVINDRLHAQMRGSPEEAVSLQEALAALRTSGGPPVVFCPGDRRFLLADGVLRLAGIRPIDSTEGRALIAQRMQEARERLFAEPSTKPPGDTGPVETSWESAFVCLEVGAGGLHLESGPLGLPRAVQTLVICSGDRNWNVLASNFRSRSWRVLLPPCTEPCRWSAPGFEDLLEEDLAKLVQPGLPAATATVFRVDTLGVGRRLSGISLTPGQLYRILIPPALASVELPASQVSPLDGGWRLWEFPVPSPCEAPLSELVKQFGLQVGAPAPIACWVISPPVAYVEVPRGESYPCFSPDPGPVLAVRSEPTSSEGELSVFLLEGAELRSLPLPAGGEWIVQLPQLPAGQYVLDVLHRSTAVEPVRLVFAIEQRAPANVSARTAVRVGEAVETPDAEGFLTLETDLASLEPAALAVQAPPLWPVDVTWDEGQRVRYGILHADPDGQLDTAELLARTQERRQRSGLGDLILDFGELGRAVLRHSRHADQEEFCRQLGQLVASRSSTLAGLGSQYPLIRSLWLDPVLRLLGYEIEEVSADRLSGLPAGGLVLLLYALRRETGRIRRRLRSVLLLMPAGTDLQNASLLGTADRLCEQLELFEAIVTDGLRWTRHRPGRRLPFPVRDVRELTGPAAGPACMQFWLEFGV